MNFRFCILFIVLFSYCAGLSAQNNPLKERSLISLKTVELDNLLSIIEDSQNLSFSYDASNFDLNKIIRNPGSFKNIEELLLYAFDEQVELRSGANRKILIIYKPRKQRITGTITDQISGEKLPNVLIYILQDPGSITTSNSNGNYILETKLRDSIDIRYKYFGSEDVFVKTFFPDRPINIELEPGLTIPDILILDTPYPFESSQQIFIEEASMFPSLLGETDVINTIKFYPQVNSGGEGQNGLIVRGGNTDQNLILVDGVPVYEMSHLGGLSSIFVDEAIKSAEIYTSGFPASFSGRLSSVVDIQLKDGSNKTFGGAFQSSLLGLKTQLEGPIVQNKTSFNLSGRISWFNPYLAPIISDLVELTDARFNYYDVQAKINHNFSPTNKLSFGYYKGRDEIEVLQLDDQESLLSFSNDNRLDWGNEIYNIQWKAAISDRHYMSSQVYWNNNELFSRGIYNYEVINDSLNIEAREFDAFTYSSINDFGIKSSVDYHYGSSSKLTYGINYIRHRYTPNIVQSRQVIPESEILDTLFEEVIDTDEWSLFIQSDNDLNDQWNLRLGLNISNYNNEESFLNLEPRLKLLYQANQNFRAQLGMSRMVQSVHQLINPGIGLPSELYVPSTVNVKPQSANEISVDFKYNFNSKLNINLGAYYKYFDNIIDYQETTDLFFYILNDADFVPPFNSGENWESRVIVGTGRSRGLEFLANYQSSKMKIWLSYSYGKSERRFEQIQNNEYFPYRYDFRHDLSLGITGSIKENIDYSLLWVYNEGRRYTLATETFTTSEGEVIPIPPNRNNQKFPAFHHLDFNLRFSELFGINELTLNAGVYNLYNRFNPYYLYLTEDENQNYKLRQLSLFPILPKFSLVYQFK